MAARARARRRLLLPLLEDIAGDRGGSDAAVRGAAAGLREAMTDGADAFEDSAHRALNGGEMEVMALLEERSDREIGEALKLSHDGVRSRLRRIFVKLDAGGRHEAVRRARTRGLLPPADGAPGVES